jgi:Trk K+ transport system NAD-binding subunit
LTFLTIGMTVVIQGLSASSVARLLGVSSTENLTAFVIGAGPFGQLIAELCMANNRPTIIIDRNSSLVEQAKCAGFEAFEGNALDEDVLEQAGLDDAETLIAVTPNSEVNTLAAQLAQDSFGISRAYPALDNPEKGASPKLIQQTGGRVAFGRTIDLGYWNRLIEDSNTQMLVMVAPKNWASKPAGRLDLPGEVLAVARLRDGSAEIVYAEQLWQANDQIIFLTEVGCTEAAPDLEKLGLRLVRQNLATVRQCLNL